MKKIENFMLPEHTNKLYTNEAISSIALTKDVADKINEIINSLNEFSKLDTEWKQEQDGRTRKAVIYMKDNLLNSLNDLMGQLRDSGFIDDRIEVHYNKIKDDVNLLDTRLDNLLGKVVEGTSTLDSEVIDVRVGIDGTIYNNAGDSVRNQITNERVKTPDYFNFKIKQNGEYPYTDVKGKFKAGDTLYIEPITTNYEYKVLNVYGRDTDNLDIENQIKIGNVVEGGYTSITLTEDFNYIRLSWELTKSVTDFEGKCICTNTNSFDIPSRVFNNFENIRDIKSNIKNILNILFNDFDDKFVDEQVFNALVNTHLEVYFNRDIKQGEEVYITVDGNNTLLDNGTIWVGCNYETGYVDDVISNFSIGEKRRFTPTENTTGFKFYIPAESVINTGTFNVVVSNYPSSDIHSRLDKLEANINRSNLSFSILGDSYSTYDKWLPETYSTWYSDEGNSQENDVASVEDTWWHKLSKDTGMPLLINSSYSGATICNTGYGVDVTTTSFITRMKKDIGEGKTTQPKPNIIFIFGGTNDSWGNSPLGTLKYNNWSSTDLLSFLPAFCYMIDYLKKYNPQARIINLINSEINSSYKNGMVEACKHYDVEYVNLDIDKTNGHPNKNGMKQIYNQIMEIL